MVPYNRNLLTYSTLRATMTDEDRTKESGIGVPYGTSLWQVGDSSEQNGSYKMACAKFKRRLFKMERQRGMSPGIHAFEVMLVVNYTWTQSFARKDKHKIAISER